MTKCFFFRLCFENIVLSPGGVSSYLLQFFEHIFSSFYCHEIPYANSIELRLAALQGKPSAEFLGVKVLSK